MALATLFNVPGNDTEMNVFSFNNQAEHVKIASALQTKFKLPIPNFILDPLPLNDMGTWLQQHQTLHNIMNGTLGTNSNDLTDVSFKDQKQLSEWIWLHAQEHYQAANILRLT